MKLLIKNMACESCKIYVKTILDELNITVNYVELGEVDTIENLSNSEQNTLNKKLQKAGLELMQDKQGVLIEKIKQEMINYVYSSEEKSPLKFSMLLSQNLHYSYSYLASFFSEIEDTTIEQYLISLKIERIKELINLDEYSLSEISYMVHYSSVAHLSSQFKKVTGLTPSHFKSLRKKRRTTIQEISLAQEV